jgi:putative hydrolase of the HAD superfamily
VKAACGRLLLLSAQPTFAMSPATSQKYLHLFFDLDHTLWDFDTASERTWRDLYEKHGLSNRGLPAFEDFFQCYCGHNDRMWERFRAGFMKREELRWKRIWHTLLDFKVYDTKLAQELSKAYLELLPTQAVLMPGAGALLDYCSGRYTMHLITNGFEQTQRLKLRHSGIEHFFSEIITSERSNSIKPQPEIFHFALSTARASCPECLMIGDALDIDVLGAISAGMDCVYYNPKRKPHSAKPTYEVAHLEELITLL